MNNNKSFDDLISEIKRQNSKLKELIDENNILRSTPFGLSSLENLNELSKRVNESFDTFNKVLKTSNEEAEKLDGSLKDIFKDSNNVVEDIKTLEERIKSLEKGDKASKKKAKELKKILEEVTESATNYYNYANKEQEELNKRIVEGTHFMDDFSEKMEKRTRALRKGVNEISKGGQQIFQSLKKTLEPWSKANHEAMAYAKSMGMSQKVADNYLANTVSWASKNDIGLLFNKTTDELIKMQSKYSEVLGRNVQLTSEQKKDMLALETIVGEDSMMNIANNLENFGLGMSDSANFVKKTYDEATKRGIVASKLTKTISDNIKMAQNYSFKNGLEGLSNMAKKAVELKTDMSFVNGFIDKVSTVEGAITTGAHLQVLGGNYAIGSDPLSMLHESLNNVEGLFDRAVGMAQGKVFYNNESGNFEMGAMDRYMMKQAATVMGVDPSEMINVAFRKASMDKIQEQASLNSNISNDKDMMELIKNIATWDNGNAVVNIGGVDKKVSDLKAEDKSTLEAMQRTDSQNLQQMAISLRSINEIVGGVGKEINNEQANAIEREAKSINNLLRQNTEMLNIVSKIGAWSNVISGATGILGGVWTTAMGVMRMGVGARNLVRGGSVGGGNMFGRSRIGRGFKGIRGNTITYGGVNYKNIGNGTLRNTSNNTIINGRRAQAILRGGSLSKMGGIARAGTGFAAGALSLGFDALSGELTKDMGGSFSRAAGVTIGSVVGSFAGPIGTMIGGWLGAAIVQGIQNYQKEGSAKVRKEISNKLSVSMPKIASLFDGENAMEGNYDKSDLNKISKALEDNVIDKNDDLGWFLEQKIRANGDFIKMNKAGVKVNLEMGNGGIINTANGGILNGKSHANGGMPILGSNIVVEGGEYVVNKRATRNNLPLLEMINNDNYKMSPIEPFGKQMSVHRDGNYSNNNSQNLSKINIQPISLNLSGTIKLESGNRQVDISNDILSNPQIITKLTEMISKQLNILDNGSYNKGYLKQKFS